MLKCPFLWSGAFLCAGLLVPSPDIDWSCWALCGVTALAGSIALCWVGRSSVGRQTAKMLLAIGFLFVGRTAILVTEIQEPFEIATLLRKQPGAFELGVAIHGNLAAPPGRGPSGTDLLVDTVWVTTGRIRHVARGRLQIRIAPSPDGAIPLLGAARGDTIDAFARLFLPRVPGNTGAFDFGRYLKAHGIDALGSVKSVRLIHWRPLVPVRPSLKLMRRIDDLRATMLRRIDDAFARDGRSLRSAPVCAALLLGERSGLAPADEARLAEAGLSHLLAVSGFNVAVLAAVLHLLTRAVGASRRLAAMVILPMLIFYLLLNRDESSVVRAVIMAVTVFGGALVWRKGNPSNSLGLAAVIILATGPVQIDDAGFQLTFTATLALILLAPGLVARGLQAPSPSVPTGRAFRPTSPRSRAARWVSAALIVSLVAAAGTLPLTIVHFNRATPGAIASNILAGPLMAAAFVGAAVIVVATPLSDRLTHATAWITAFLVEMTFRIADGVHSIPWMSYRRVTPGPASVILYYVALLWLIAARGALQPARWKCRLAALALGVCALFLLLPLDTREPPEGLRLTAIDVGQGDAILVETSGGTRMLVDAGGATRAEFDVGERVVAPALWNLGISRLDYLAVTHPDVDHAGGSAAIVTAFAPHEIWLPAGASSWTPRRAISRLRQAARENLIPIQELAAGEIRCLRGACVKILHPPGPGEPGTAENEQSLVMLISSHGRSALLVADAGAATERRLESVVTQSDYLKVGHHGSRTSSTPAFLQRVRPRIAIISCGARNRFGHPDTGVLARLERLHARVCRTDQHGAIEVELRAHPRSATLVDSDCLLSRGGSYLHVTAEERPGNETENEDDEGRHRNQDTAYRKTP